MLSGAGKPKIRITTHGMEPQPGFFKSTRWSTVLCAGQPDAPGSDGALARLCEDYRPPLYQFARGWLRSPEDAEDLTQGFFGHFIERNLPGMAGQDRGRFRTFLLACFKNYLRDELRRNRRARVIPVELLSSFEAGSEDDAAPVPSPAVNPAVDRQLDALWAESIRQRVVGRMATAYGERGKAGLFARLKPLLEGQKPGQTYAQIAMELGVAEPVINVEVMRLRDRFRKEFREEVGQTVNDPAQLDEEFRYLLSLLFTRAHP